MNYVERVLSFKCAGERLLGIVAIPSGEQAQAETGVVVIVGGPQYRVGSHRQFVSLARRLAAAGFPVLRFDCRGMGDSSGELRHFESIADDVAAAINALQSDTGAKNIALWGLCDGASAALLYCGSRQDTRVKGLCLLNPWVRSDVGLAKTRIKHYYGQRIRQREFWIKLLRGKVAWSALKGVVENITSIFATSRLPPPTLSYQEEMAKAWFLFKGSIMLILSGKDLTAREFVDHALSSPAWRKSLQKEGVHRHDISGADHTFSSRSTQEKAEALTIDWLNKLA